jgi:hypothetical protein
LAKDTVNELATEALQKELARRSFEKIKREAEPVAVA